MKDERRYDVFGCNGAYAIRDNKLEQRTENRFSKKYANTLVAKLKKSLIIDQEFLADDIEAVEYEMNKAKKSVSTVGVQGQNTVLIAACVMVLVFM